MMITTDCHFGEKRKPLELGVIIYFLNLPETFANCIVDFSIDFSWNLFECYEYMIRVFLNELVSLILFTLLKISKTRYILTRVHFFISHKDTLSVRYRRMRVIILWFRHTFPISWFGDDKMITLTLEKKKLRSSVSNVRIIF